MERKESSKVYRYKGKPMLVGIITKIKTEDHIHKITHLVNFRGKKVETLDDFVGFDSNNVEKYIVNKVICYKNYFVVQETIKDFKTDKVKKNYNFTKIYNYDGFMVYSTIEPWKESSFVKLVAEKLKNTHHELY